MPYVPEAQNMPAKNAPDAQNMPEKDFFKEPLEKNSNFEVVL